MMAKPAHKLTRVLASVALVCGVGTFSTTVASASTAKDALAFNFKAIGPAKATGKTLSLAKASPGIFLIGPNGHSLYVYNKDKGTKSACTGTCHLLAGLDCQRDVDSRRRHQEI